MPSLPLSFAVIIFVVPVLFIISPVKLSIPDLKSAFIYAPELSIDATSPNLTDVTFALDKTCILS